MNKTVSMVNVWGVILTVAAALLAHTRVFADRTSRVGFRSEPEQLVVTVDDKAVASYVFEDAEILRPYFAHVKSLDGVQVTRGHPPVPDQDPTDHASMHPGIWMAFGDLNGEDFWRNKGRVVHQGFVSGPRGGNDRGQFTVKNRYFASDGKRVCDELCRIEFRVRSKGYWLLWESTFSAKHRLVFGDQEEMGLGVRVATPLSVQHQGVIRDASGRQNEKEIWGQVNPWSDYHATIDARHIGIALMCHPANFRPSWWHVRDYGLMVANPFGRDAFAKGPPSEVIVESEDAFRLRYAFFIYATASQAPPNLEDTYQEYLEITRR